MGFPSMAVSTMETLPLSPGFQEISAARMPLALEIAIGGLERWQGDIWKKTGRITMIHTSWEIEWENSWDNDGIYVFFDGIYR